VCDFVGPIFALIENWRGVRGRKKLVNILDLLKQDGFHHKRTAATNGGEWHSACVWCGGEDRLCIWPNSKEGRMGGQYWCRRCGKHGDAVQYLKETRHMRHVDACAYLNIKPFQKELELPSHMHSWSPKEAKPPCELWRKKAGAFLRETIEVLWSSSGRESRRWLQKCKGLQDITVREAKIGFNATETYRKRELWGLEQSINEKNGKPRKIWLPAGIVIPCFHDGNLVRLRIRRLNEERSGRYIIVSGSNMRAMVFSPDKSVQCIVESELDALLLHQEVRNLTGIVSIGSANARPDKETDKILRRSRLILLSLDYDVKSGNPKPAFNFQFWMAQYDNVKRWPCPKGKDPGDAFLDGVNLQVWIESALQ